MKITFVKYPENKPKENKQYMVLLKNRYGVNDVEISSFDKQNNIFDYFDDKNYDDFDGKFWLHEIIGFIDIENNFSFNKYSDCKPKSGKYYLCHNKHGNYSIEYFSNGFEKFDRNDDMVIQWAELPNIDNSQQLLFVECLKFDDKNYDDFENE